MRAVFVPGEPILSGGKGQVEWQEAIRHAYGQEILSPKLTFVVSALKRRGHSFDLDNLVHPVLMVFDDPIERVWARIRIGESPGLLIEDTELEDPPDDPLRSLYVAEHSRLSARGRVGIPDIEADEIFSDHDGLGLALRFDSDDIPIRRGWFGPTEAVIDDLVAWFGTYTSRELIADHRIRDLRIERGVRPEAYGVHITLWYVPDDEVHQDISQ